VFIGILPSLERFVMERYANPRENDQCRCGKGKCVVNCFDCLQYEISCAECFVAQHLRSPLHWAQVWDPARGYYTKFDYSFILPEVIRPFRSGTTVINAHDPPAFRISCSPLSIQTAFMPRRCGSASVAAIATRSSNLCERSCFPELLATR